MLAASQVFLALSKQAAARWKFSPLFISLIVVALGTNLPELTVTFAAVAQNDIDLAFGNLLGSSIANLTLVLGISSLFNHVRIGTTKTPKNALLLLGVTLMFAAVSIARLPDILSAVLLLTTTGLALSYQYRLARFGRLHEDKRLLQLLDTFTTKKRQVPASIFILSLISSIVGLAVGGFLGVTAIEGLATHLGLSTTFLGFTLTALSTSLPELVTTVVASQHRDEKMVLGTLIGSNIFNASTFPAIIYLFRKDVQPDVIGIIGTTAVAVIFLSIVYRYTGRNIPKIVSVSLVSLYICFSLAMYTISSV